MTTRTDRDSASKHPLAALLLLATPLALSGCAGKSDTSVAGRMLHTPETFTGTTTASLDGTGSLELKSNHGAYCSGPYTQQPDDNTAEKMPGGGTPPQGKSGMARLTCRDGRTGQVMFLVGPDQAVGTGMLGRDIVTLTIGGI
jgi:hypothetical protein